MTGTRTYFKLLFLTEFYKEEELEQQEMMYYEGFDAKQEDLILIRKKFEKIKENLEQIDGQINEVAKGWRTDRMGEIDAAYSAASAQSEMK